MAVEVMGMDHVYLAVRGLRRSEDFHDRVPCRAEGREPRRLWSPRWRAINRLSVSSRWK